MRLTSPPQLAQNFALTMKQLTSCQFLAQTMTLVLFLAEWNIVTCLKLEQTITLIQNVSLPIIGTISISTVKLNYVFQSLLFVHILFMPFPFIKRNSIQKNTLLRGATCARLVMLKRNFQLLYARHTVTYRRLKRKKLNILIFCEMKKKLARLICKFSSYKQKIRLKNFNWKSKITSYFYISQTNFFPICVSLWY